MFIRADVKCYYCGHISGQIEGDKDNADSRWNYRASNGASASMRQAMKRIRCDRCGGPVFLDEIETVRYPQHLPTAAFAVALR